MHNILAIDDSADIHLLLAARLKHEDIVLHTAFDGGDGIRQAQELLPDVILLDLELPDLTGFDVCARLKADPETANIPVMFLTATDAIDVKVQGLELGAMDYVTKPFVPEELRARVRGALRIKRSHDLLTASAHVDATTGLWNRRSFDQRLTEELAGAVRYGRDVTLALIDLDHFKQLNDTYGHDFGDHVLGHLGRVLSENARKADAPCRFGGEEFAVIMRGTSSDGGVSAAMRLGEAIRAIELRHNGELVRITASVGVAGTDLLHAVTEKELIQSADQALYAAKRSGRDRVVAAPHAPHDDSNIAAALAP